MRAIWRSRDTFPRISGDRSLIVLEAGLRGWSSSPVHFPACLNTCASNWLSPEFPRAQPGPAPSAAQCPPVAFRLGSCRQPGLRGSAAGCFLPTIYQPLPWNGKEPQAGRGPSQSSVVSATLSSEDTVESREGRLKEGSRGAEGWRGWVVVNSPVQPVGIRPSLCGSSYPVGSGRCFCLVILSCPEGSWPRATFLVGSECHKARERPFSPAPRSSAPHTGWSLSSLCWQQAFS